MAPAESFSLSFPEKDIAVLTFDMPDKGANILSASILDELSSQLDRIETREGLAGLIIISGKPGVFIAGADLREFVSSIESITPEQTEKMCRKGQILFGRLSKCPFVTVAAIDGLCIGGGAEVAVWCDRRVLTNGEKTEIGFPEVKLGIFPGWGGTARVPRMIGLSNAVEIITSGDSLDAQAAVDIGLAEDITDPENLLAAAINLVRQEQKTGRYLKDRKLWNGPIDISETEISFLGATASAFIQGKTKGQYPAPLAALEVMLAAAAEDVETACRMEASGMSQLFGTPINASLLNIFFLTDRNKKDPGVEQDVTPKKIGSVAVIGAGIMGAGIGAANLRRSIPVTITDASEESLAKGVRSIIEEVSYNKKIKGRDIDRAIEYSALLNGTKSEDEISECELIIEAVVENAELKKQIYTQLEPKLRPDAILASNTSTIPITSLAEGLKHPERFCGIHFFNPVRKMKLVEVIRGKKTSDETIATAVAHAKRLGKSPIVVNDGPGFLVNRLLLPYMNEALELICEGAEIKAIEKTAKQFGMPMGPIHLYDMVGLDTAFYAGRTMLDAFPDRIIASPILGALVRGGRLGIKSGSGFFSYQNKKRKAEVDPELDKFIEPYLRSKEKFSSDDLTKRLFLPMLLEATRILEEKIVRNVRDVDLGLIFGVGFPPFKGGLLFWADTIGAEQIVEQLKPLEHLGERARPTDLLLNMAQHGKNFYEL